jgi:hypothetical protein
MNNTKYQTLQATETTATKKQKHRTLNSYFFFVLLQEM